MVNNNMNIKVEINKKEPNKNIIESEEIICPECKESILVKIEDCKIRMYKCRNNHKIDKLLTLEEFRNTQRINKFTIKCNICNDILYSSFNYPLFLKNLKK